MADDQDEDQFQHITIQASLHPDAQATVSDFSDYTEYYPSDLVRSLTLIEKLNQDYVAAAARVHDLTTTYADLPDIHPEIRPDPQQLRKEISECLEQAILYREAAAEEARRLSNVTDRHFHRLGTIRRKLEALPKPPSRDPTPVPVSSPISRKRPEPDRGPRLTLHFDGSRQVPGDRPPKQQNRRPPVLGEVLMPQPVESEGFESESDMDVVPALTTPKIKIPKTPRIRIPGTAGTNVHSAVAGISTSNALARLTPPPADAAIGSKHAPWFRLTEWEMAKLRKQMKKNAVWTPSQTMIERELAMRGRGEINFNKSKAEAEEKGIPFINDDQTGPPPSITADGDIRTAEAKAKEGEELLNRGMKMNQAKKLKREILAKEQKAQAQMAREAVDLEEASQLMMETGNLMKTLFAAANATPSTANKKKIDALKFNKKRKRDSTPEPVPVATVEPTPTPSQEPTGQPNGKRLKIIPPAPAKPQETPVPLPSASPNPPSAPNSAKTVTMQIPLAPAGPSTPNHVPSSRKQTPALTSPTENKQNPAAPTTAAASRSRRPSIAPKPKSPENGQTLLLPKPSTRPPSRAGAATKAASAEPQVKQELSRLRDLRRGSNVSLPVSADPAPAPALRTRRKPAPGPVTTDENGRGKTTVAKRKKKGHKRSKSEEDQAGDYDVVDPNEPKYCICDGVSWGDMIACSDDNCEKEWFHFDCVNISVEDMPARRAKWYCPDCRGKLGVDEKGNPADAPPVVTNNKRVSR